MALLSKDEIIEQLKTLIIKDNAQITIHDLCRTYQLHIDDAKEILNEFITTANNKDLGGLSVSYYVHWIEPATENCLTLQRFLIVNGQDDLNFYQNSHENVHHYVYGVCTRKNAIKNELVFDKYPIFDDRCCDLDFESIQKTTYIRNDQIRIRPNKRDLIVEQQQPQQNGEQKPSLMEKISIKTESTTVESPSKKRQQPNDDGDEKQSNGTNKSKETSKKYKRIKIENDDDDENMFDDDVDEKLFDDIINKEIEMKNVNDKPSSQPQKPKQEQPPEPTKNILKVKKQTQSSIMNFFKKK
ncbi:uncharacterized protein LOC113797817 [Dermatophagoides pteronyssinus]|uniref:uncharacterized protein LOC113797817 n=1 Tax=Dermatophagoides pteronyssinus TaxID=6956 RepID=UPI003F675C07